MPEFQLSDRVFPVVADDNASGVRTVAEVLTAAGIDPDRAARHLAAGWVRVDGEPVTDPAHPVPAGARVNLYAT